MSVYVTDTHALVFYVTGLKARLSRRALRAFEQAERGEAYIYISAVTLWEISRLEQGASSGSSSRMKIGSKRCWHIRASNACR